MLVVRIYSYETLLFAKFVGVHVFILNCIACRLQQRNFKMLSFAGIILMIPFEFIAGYKYRAISTGRGLCIGFYPIYNNSYYQRLFND